MTQLATRLGMAGLPHMVPLQPSVTPRLAYLWLRRHLPEADASVVPYPAPNGDYGIAFAIGFNDPGQAAVFAAGQARGLE